ncbi:Uncharacterised protein [Streptococcus pneumoniae]|nr:Uncharacterised protein [Streptococcus pneumoniae]
MLVIALLIANETLFPCITPFSPENKSKLLTALLYSSFIFLIKSIEFFISESSIVNLIGSVVTFSKLIVNPGIVSILFVLLVPLIPFIVYSAFIAPVT